MSAPLVHGLYAAVLVPRDASGKLDEAAFCRVLEFLIERRLNRLVLNGVTGEYYLTSPEEFDRMLRLCRETLGPSGEFLAAIGSAGIHGVMRLAGIALGHGAKALLLPMPHFFVYSQGDLRAWCESVARGVEAPILLYNVPRFTNGLTPATVAELMRAVPNIRGIKDSSGNLDILAALTEARIETSRIVGDDGILPAAMERNLCDGVISGVAGVLPELMISVWDGRGTVPLLREVVARLAGLPVPWGLKWIAEARGISPATFAQPVSPERAAERDALLKWFAGWWDGAGRILPAAFGGYRQDARPGARNPKV
jgi:4-hydroxy-tetrahydrodipicolinate synthase